LLLGWHLKDWIGIAWHWANPGVSGGAAEELPGAEGEFGNSEDWREKIKQTSKMGFVYLNVLAARCTYKGKINLLKS